MTPEAFLEQEEGESGKQEDGSFKAVWDSIGKCWTIGPGLTRGVVKSTHWSAEEIGQRFHEELESFAETVDRAVKVRLNENQRTVLISFCYNVGQGDFLKSSVLEAVNRTLYSLVPVRLALYVHGRGVKGIVPGLVNRRKAEIRLWNTPVASPPPPPMNLLKEPTPKAREMPSFDFGGAVAGFFQNIIVGMVNVTSGLGSSMDNTQPTPTINVPLTQTPILIGQLGTFARGVFKIVGAGLLGTVLDHWSQIQSLANETNFWLGAAMVIVGQSLSQLKVAQSDKLTLATVHDLSQQVNTLSPK